MENIRPEGVRINLKELIKELSNAYWIIDSIEKRFKKDLDDYWVTLPHLNKLIAIIKELNDSSTHTLQELRTKAEEFRMYALGGEDS